MSARKRRRPGCDRATAKEILGDDRKEFNSDPRGLSRIKSEIGFDAASESDRIFFEEHPGRRHRLRRAFQFEVQQVESLGGAFDIPDSAWLFAAIKVIGPGLRARVFATAGLNTKDTEAAAREMFAAAMTVRS